MTVLERRNEGAAAEFRCLGAGEPHGRALASAAWLLLDSSGGGDVHTLFLRRSASPTLERSLAGLSAPAFGWSPPSPSPSPSPLLLRPLPTCSKVREPPREPLGLREKQIGGVVPECALSTPSSFGVTKLGLHDGVPAAPSPTPPLASPLGRAIPPPPRPSHAPASPCTRSATELTPPAPQAPVPSTPL
eukprot:43136-Pleurochrysis_carterae.AAC.1